MDSSVTSSPYASTHQTRPIPIPPRRMSASRPNDSVKNQPEPEYPSLSNRKRRENKEAVFRDVNWQGKQDAAHKDNITPLRTGSSSRSSSVAGNKRALSKENGNGLFRRTSQTCKYKFQKAIGNRSRRSSTDCMDGVEESSYRESTPSGNASNNKNFMDRFASNRLVNHLKPSRNDTPAPAYGATSSSHSTVASRPATAHYFLDSNHSSSSQQFPQFDPYAGSSRKAAADFHYSEAERDQARRRLGSNSSAADSGADLCSSDVEMLDAEEVSTLMGYRTPYR